MSDASGGIVSSAQRELPYDRDRLLPDNVVVASSGEIQLDEIA